MAVKRNLVRSSAPSYFPERRAWYWPLLIGIAALSVGCGDTKITDIELPDVDLPDIVDKIPLPNIVYKLDIQQGNVITQEMVDQLKPGMNKRRVLFVLGTPLIVSAFNKDRWDYVYTFQPGGGEREQRKLTLFFEDEQLQRIEGDVVPPLQQNQQQDQPQLPSIDATPGDQPLPVAGDADSMAP
uniref:Outer membrane protein assembly factor BamE n=1 Tax=Candidatus Kentrum sp. FW TaxID=2126338 RepID=A0A450S969_9GAMM|nr:MAG: Outer membrane protein assembly factor BamE, lipoprotein component of the BamABCDE complex [Candidatus Kentron sp. FW]VFJ59339.1 MAG: Outer membrane protein assembly factor BamE, lipoprotein component of the BamABCDE complex [Candidatus Kentron sp. FW]